MITHRPTRRRPNASICRCIWLAGWLTLSAQAQPASQPASAPAIKDFAPGIQIDWPNHAVRVQSRVVFREGPLELLACFPGKEHESILLISAAPTRLYQALGLVGLSPGRPAKWDEAQQTFDPPQGDLIDVTLEWQVAGQARRAPALGWVREREYARPARNRPFIFAGSLPGANGKLAAESTGVALALVDFSDSLLTLSQHFTSRNAELWAEANTTEIPPLSAEVWLVLRAAKVERPSIKLDWLGDFYLNNRFEHAPEIADAIQLWRRAGRPEPITILNEARLTSDRARAAQALQALRIEPDWIEWIDRPSPTSKPSH